MRGEPAVRGTTSRVQDFQRAGSRTSKGDHRWPSLGSDTGDWAVYGWFLRGLRDVWLLLPDYLGFVVSARLEQDLGSVGLAAADIELGTLAPVGSGAGDEVEELGQLGVEGAARLGGFLLLGLRGTAAWLMTQSDGDLAQLALVPFVRCQIGLGMAHANAPKPAFVEARLVVNLDAPLGFSFQGSGIDVEDGAGGSWTFVLRAGADFP